MFAFCILGYFDSGIQSQMRFKQSVPYTELARKCEGHLCHLYRVKSKITTKGCSKALVYRGPRLWVQYRYGLYTLELDWMIFLGHFQLRLYCDSVT